MEVKKEIISTDESLTDTIPIEIKAVDNYTLSIDELIASIALLSKNKNPYTVSKEIEEIKSTFYIKLNLEKQEELKDKETKEQEKNTKERLSLLEINFKTFFDDYRKNKSKFRNNKEKEEEKNLKTKRQIIEEIDELAKEKESLKTTFEKFRLLQEKWKNTGHVPITENNHLWQSYNHHIELFYDFIKLNNDLRDLDFKRNLEEKKEICKKATLLLKEKSVNKAHHNLQELHDHWKNVGPVEREQREPLWEKFQEISRTINKKRNDFFVKRKKQDSIKIGEKNIICTEINNLTTEEINSNYKWQEATKACSELEIKWRSIAGLNKESNKIAWKKLRDSLNNFYNTKNNFYKQKKESHKQVLENKLAICKKAEELQKSTDWRMTGKKLIKLQEEWKDSGFSAARQSNESWKRFKIACDTFFNSRKAHYKKIEKEEKKAYKKKEALINELKGFTASSDSKKNIERLNEFSLKWNNSASIIKNKIDINNQFLNLLNSKFAELGLNKKALSNKQYENRVDSIKGNKEAINDEKKYINNKIDYLKKEIIQYENNISFFGNGKDTQLIIEKTQKTINNKKADIDELKQKIQLLNKV